MSMKAVSQGLNATFLYVIFSFFFLSQIEMFHEVSDKKDAQTVICFNLKLKFQECVTTAAHDLYKM